jgi:hypothetical protein
MATPSAAATAGAASGDVIDRAAAAAAASGSGSLGGAASARLISAEDAASRVALIREKYPALAEEFLKVAQMTHAEFDA